MRLTRTIPWVFSILLLFVITGNTSASGDGNWNTGNTGNSDVSNDNNRNQTNNYSSSPNLRNDGFGSNSSGFSNDTNSNSSNRSSGFNVNRNGPSSSNYDRASRSYGNQSSYQNEGNSATGLSYKTIERLSNLDGCKRQALTDYRKLLSKPSIRLQFYRDLYQRRQKNALPCDGSNEEVVLSYRDRAILLKDHHFRHYLWNKMSKQPISQAIRTQRFTDYPVGPAVNVLTVKQRYVAPPPSNYSTY